MSQISQKITNQMPHNKAKQNKAHCNRIKSSGTETHPPTLPLFALGFKFNSLESSRIKQQLEMQLPDQPPFASFSVDAQRTTKMPKRNSMAHTMWQSSARAPLKFDYGQLQTISCIHEGTRTIPNLRRSSENLPSGAMET